MTRGMMDEKIFSRVLENLRYQLSSVKVVVLYHGGEPLLNKNFVSMLKEVKSLGIPFVKTVSNGMIFPDDILEGIVAHQLDAIEFSLDGASPEENNYIRRKSDYATVVSNIKHLIQYKRAQKAQLPKIFLSSAQFLVPDDYHHKNQQPVPPAYLVREFSGEYAGEIAGFKCTWAMRWPHMEVLDNIYDVYVDPYETKPSNYCDHVNNTITIRWNGDVVGCCFDLTSEYVLGNIVEHDLATIWNNQKYLHLRESIDKMDFIDMCEKCNVVKPNVFLVLKPDVISKLKEDSDKQLEAPEGLMNAKTRHALKVKSSL